MLFENYTPPRGYGNQHKINIVYLALLDWSFVYVFWNLFSNVLSQTPFNHRPCSVNIHPFPLTPDLVFIGSDAKQELLVWADGNYVDLW